MSTSFKQGEQIVPNHNVIVTMKHNEESDSGISSHYQLDINFGSAHKELKIHLLPADLEEAEKEKDITDDKSSVIGDENELTQQEVSRKTFRNALIKSSINPLESVCDYKEKDIEELFTLGKTGLDVCSFYYSGGKILPTEANFCDLDLVNMAKPSMAFFSKESSIIPKLLRRNLKNGISDDLNVQDTDKTSKNSHLELKKNTSDSTFSKLTSKRNSEADTRKKRKKRTVEEKSITEIFQPTHKRKSEKKQKHREKTENGDVENNKRDERAIEKYKSIKVKGTGDGHPRSKKKKRSVDENVLEELLIHGKQSTRGHRSKGKKRKEHGSKEIIKIKSSKLLGHLENEKQVYFVIVAKKDRRKLKNTGTQGFGAALDPNESFPEKEVSHAMKEEQILQIIKDKIGINDSNMENGKLVNAKEQEIKTKILENAMKNKKLRNYMLHPSVSIEIVNKEQKLKEKMNSKKANINSFENILENSSKISREPDLHDIGSGLTSKCPTVTESQKSKNIKEKTKDMEKKRRGRGKSKDSEKNKEIKNDKNRKLGKTKEEEQKTETLEPKVHSRSVKCNTPVTNSNVDESLQNSQITEILQKIQELEFNEKQKRREEKRKHRHKRHSTNQENESNAEKFRREISFSQLNLTPMPDFYRSSSKLTAERDLSRSKTTRSSSKSSSTKKPEKMRKRNKNHNYEKKSTTSEAVTKKERNKHKLQHDILANYFDRAQLKTSVFSKKKVISTDRLLEISTKALDKDGSMTIGFTVEGIEPPKRLEPKPKLTDSDSSKNEEVLKKLHMTFFPVMEIKAVGAVNSCLPNVSDLKKRPDSKGPKQENNSKESSNDEKTSTEKEKSSENSSKVIVNQSSSNTVEDTSSSSLSQKKSKNGNRFVKYKVPKRLKSKDSRFEKVDIIYDRKNGKPVVRDTKVRKAVELSGRKIKEKNENQKLPEIISKKSKKIMESGNKKMELVTTIQKVNKLSSGSVKADVNVSNLEIINEESQSHYSSTDTDGFGKKKLEESSWRKKSLMMVNVAEVKEEPRNSACSEQNCFDNHDEIDNYVDSKSESKSSSSSNKKMIKTPSKSPHRNISKEEKKKLNPDTTGFKQNEKNIASKNTSSSGSSVTTVNSSSQRLDELFKTLRNDKTVSLTNFEESLDKLITKLVNTNAGVLKVDKYIKQLDTEESHLKLLKLKEKAKSDLQKISKKDIFASTSSSNFKETTNTKSAPVKASKLPQSQSTCLFTKSFKESTAMSKVQKGKEYAENLRRTKKKKALNDSTSYITGDSAEVVTFQEIGQENENSKCVNAFQSHPMTEVNKVQEVFAFKRKNNAEKEQEAADAYYNSPEIKAKIAKLQFITEDSKKTKHTDDSRYGFNQPGVPTCQSLVCAMCKKLLCCCNKSVLPPDVEIPEIQPPEKKVPVIPTIIRPKKTQNVNVVQTFMVTTDTINPLVQAESPPSVCSKCSLESKTSNSIKDIAKNITHVNSNETTSDDRVEVKPKLKKSKTKRKMPFSRTVPSFGQDQPLEKIDQTPQQPFLVLSTTSSYTVCTSPSEFLTKVEKQLKRDKPMGKNLKSVYLDQRKKDEREEVVCKKFRNKTRFVQSKRDIKETNSRLFTHDSFTQVRECDNLETASRDFSRMQSWNNLISPASKELILNTVHISEAALETILNLLQFDPNLVLPYDSPGTNCPSVSQSVQRIPTNSFVKSDNQIQCYDQYPILSKNINTKSSNSHNSILCYSHGAGSIPSFHNICRKDYIIPNVSYRHRKPFYLHTWSSRRDNNFNIINIKRKPSHTSTEECNFSVDSLENRHKRGNKNKRIVNQNDINKIPFPRPTITSFFVYNTTVETCSPYSSSEKKTDSNTQISEESGYESNKTKKSAFKNFFQKGGGLLDIFRKNKKCKKKNIGDIATVAETEISLPSTSAEPSIISSLDSKTSKKTNWSNVGSKVYKFSSESNKFYSCKLSDSSENTKTESLDDEREKEQKKSKFYTINFNCFKNEVKSFSSITKTKQESNKTLIGKSSTDEQSEYEILGHFVLNNHNPEPKPNIYMINFNQEQNKTNCFVDNVTKSPENSNYAKEERVNVDETEIKEIKPPQTKLIQSVGVTNKRQNKCVEHKEKCEDKKGYLKRHHDMMKANKLENSPKLKCNEKNVQKIKTIGESKPSSKKSHKKRHSSKRSNENDSITVLYNHEKVGKQYNIKRHLTEYATKKYEKEQNPKDFLSDTDCLLLPIKHDNKIRKQKTSIEKKEKKVKKEEVKIEKKEKQIEKQEVKMERKEKQIEKQEDKIVEKLFEALNIMNSMHELSEINLSFDFVKKLMHEDVSDRGTNKYNKSTKHKQDVSSISGYMSDYDSKSSNHSIKVHQEKEIKLQNNETCHRKNVLIVDNKKEEIIEKEHKTFLEMAMSKNIRLDDEVFPIPKDINIFTMEEEKSAPEEDICVHLSKEVATETKKLCLCSKDAEPTNMKKGSRFKKPKLPILFIRKPKKFPEIPSIDILDSNEQIQEKETAVEISSAELNEVHDQIVPVELTYSNSNSKLEQTSITQVNEISIQTDPQDNNSNAKHDILRSLLENMKESAIQTETINSVPFDLNLSKTISPIEIKEEIKVIESDVGTTNESKSYEQDELDERYFKTDDKDETPVKLKVDKKNRCKSKKDKRSFRSLTTFLKKNDKCLQADCSFLSVLPQNKQGKTKCVNCQCWSKTEQKEGKSNKKNTRNCGCKVLCEYAKQVNECHAYAEKVRIESKLRQDGYLKQFLDFKEIPLSVLLGRAIKTRSQDIPKRKQSAIKCNDITTEGHSFDSEYALNGLKLGLTIEQPHVEEEKNMKVEKDKNDEKDKKDEEDEEKEEIDEEVEESAVSFESEAKVLTEEEEEEGVNENAFLLKRRNIEEEQEMEKKAIAKISFKIAKEITKEEDINKEIEVEAQMSGVVDDVVDTAIKEGVPVRWENADDFVEERKSFEEFRKNLTDKEIFNKLLDTYEKDDEIADKLSNDETFFETQLSTVKSKDSATKFIQDVDVKVSFTKKKNINDIDPIDVGSCFSRGFRPDNIALTGDACFSLNKQDKLKGKSDLLDNESIIDFSERDTPLDYLLGLGFMVDEATNALKDEDVEHRLLAAITEARVWINQITTSQGTLLYLVAYKARPKVMRYFLQLVEAIINKRINNAVKLDGFLRVLEKIEMGEIGMIRLFKFNQFEDEENEERLVKNQLREVFMMVYKTAEKEACSKNKKLHKSQVLLLRILAARYRAGLNQHLELIARYIGKGLLATEVQLEAAMIFLSRLDTDEVKIKEFETYCDLQEKKEKKRDNIRVNLS